MQVGRLMLKFQRIIFILENYQSMEILLGPRQCGKTTMGKSLLKDEAGYLNWDVAEHREKILRRELPVAPLPFFLSN